MGNVLSLSVGMFRRITNGRPDVLVVNPHPTVSAQLTRALRDAGFQVVQTSSFYEAKRVLSAELPRLLIADVRLGEFNGLNLAWHRELTLPGPTIITDVVRDPVLAAEAQKLDAPYLMLSDMETVLSMAVQLLGAPARSVPVAPFVSASRRIGHSVN